VFRDRAADHQALQRVAVHIADSFPRPQWLFEVAEFEEFTTGLAADALDKVVCVNGAPRGLLQILAGLDRNRFTANGGAALDIQLDLRRELALLVAGV